MENIWLRGNAMAENPYFSRVMDAVDLIAGENVRKKRVAEQQDYNLGMMRSNQAFQREMADKRVAGQEQVQMLRNVGDIAEIQEKDRVKKEGLVGLPADIEKQFPALAGFGKIWSPSEVSMIVNRGTQAKGLGEYRSGMLGEKQKDRAERKKHNIAMESKSKAQSGVGSADPRKRLEALRKEAIDLLKSGYYGDYVKEPANKDQVTAYVERLDALLKKQRSGKLSDEENKEIDDIESFLVYSSNKDKRQAAGEGAVGRLTDILGRLEKEF